MSPLTAITTYNVITPLNTLLLAALWLLLPAASLHTNTQTLSFPPGTDGVKQGQKGPVWFLLWGLRSRLDWKQQKYSERSGSLLTCCIRYRWEDEIWFRKSSLREKRDETDFTIRESYRSDSYFIVCTNNHQVNCKTLFMLLSHFPEMCDCTHLTVQGLNYDKCLPAAQQHSVGSVFKAGKTMQTLAQNVHRCKRNQANCVRVHLHPAWKSML